MKNRISKIIIISIFMILFYVFLNHVFFECIFRKYLGIACPGCGLTRAFRYLIHFKIIDAIKMNFLSIPLCILMVITFILLILDIIKNKYNTEKFIMHILNKYKYLIIVLLIIAIIVNNLNPLIMTSNSLFYCTFLFFSL